jgi:hypothetical protein
MLFNAYGTSDETFIETGLVSRSTCTPRRHTKEIFEVNKFVILN